MRKHMLLWHWLSHKLPDVLRLEAREGLSTMWFVGSRRSESCCSWQPFVHKWALENQWQWKLATRSQQPHDNPLILSQLFQLLAPNSAHIPFCAFLPINLRMNRGSYNAQLNSSHGQFRFWTLSFHQVSVCTLVSAVVSPKSVFWSSKLLGCNRLKIQAGCLFHSSVCWNFMAGASQFSLFLVGPSLCFEVFHLEGFPPAVSML